jgi:hypothetical protein
MNRPTLVVDRRLRLDDGSSGESGHERKASCQALSRCFQGNQPGNASQNYPLAKAQTSLERSLLSWSWGPIGQRKDFRMRRSIG